jgi:8-hydroxy-5-deazaflavin:NADPH oxidoreductase
MKIGILGTGTVGDTVATKLIQLGHQVLMGARQTGNEKAVAWAKKSGANASQGTFADAARFGELLFNCTSGQGSLDALRQAGAENLSDKILIDISNPLDFSRGMPPSLFICNTDSLGEQLQQAFPRLKIVKALNTVNCSIMVNPALLPGDHCVFVSGNNLEAKATVTLILEEWFGWNTVIDLGDISTARGTEMLLPLWVRLYSKFQSPNFNFAIVHQV